MANTPADVLNGIGTIYVADSVEAQPDYDSSTTVSIRWSSTAITGTVATDDGSTLTLSAEGTIAAGDVILAGTEEMYVSAVTSDGSKEATVTRGYNGTTAAAHSAAALSVESGWTQVGYTEGEYHAEFGAELEEVKVNEHFGPIAHVVTSEFARVGITFAQKSAADIALGLPTGTLSATSAGATQTAQDNLSLGDGTTVATKSLLIVDKNGEGFGRYIYIPKCVCTTGVDFKLAKEQTTFDLEFEGQVNTDGSAGERMLIWTDITGSTT